MAHVLRAWGSAHGEILPSTEVGGRKGLYLPADLHDDFAFFEAARRRFGAERFSYREVLRDYMQRPPDHAAGDARPPVFIPYEGSAGYTPPPYLPPVAAALDRKSVGEGRGGSGRLVLRGGRIMKEKNNRDKEK